MKKVVILSGGLDSTIAIYKIVKEIGKENVFALTFDYGQRHHIEMEKSKITCKKLQISQKILNIDFFGELVKDKSSLIAQSILDVPDIEDVLGQPQPITYVPFRNGLFSMIAFSYAESIGAEKIVLGLQKHDLYQYWDTTKASIDRLNEYSLLNRETLIQIETPFVEMSKAQEIKLGIELNVPFEDTWTCYNPYFDRQIVDFEYEACGKCPSCSERLMNFKLVGIKDPIKYRSK